MAGERTEPKRLCMSKGMWAAYTRGGPAHDGPWEFADTEHCEDPDTAARVVCSRRWTAGTHDVLVVGIESAHLFRITLDTEIPNDH